MKRQYPLWLIWTEPCSSPIFCLNVLLSSVRNKPLQFLKSLAWLTHGKAYLKERLAQASDIDVGTLPYDPDVLWMIEAQRNKGRKIVLATASHHSLAVRIAEHLNVFDEVTRDDP